MEMFKLFCKVSQTSEIERKINKAQIEEWLKYLKFLLKKGQCYFCVSLASKYVCVCSSSEILNLETLPKNLPDKGIFTLSDTDGFANKRVGITNSIDSGHPKLVCEAGQAGDCDGVVLGVPASSPGIFLIVNLFQLEYFKCILLLSFHFGSYLILFNWDTSIVLNLFPKKCDGGSLN